MIYYTRECTFIQKADGTIQEIWEHQLEIPNFVEYLYGNSVVAIWRVKMKPKKTSTSHWWAF